MAKMTIIFEDAFGDDRNIIKKRVDLSELERDIRSTEIEDDTGQVVMNEMRQAVGAIAIDMWEMWEKL
jgi:hypothetical protein